MIDLDTLIHIIQTNCDISDARYAGHYSVCGLALRLRDLYKWKKGLEPWVEGDSSLVLEWIGEREEAWEELEDKDFGQITAIDKRYDPFDVSEINAILEPLGVLYGAGYVHSLKPSFFLGQLEGRREIDGHPVFTIGRELARDLLSVPALSQDGCVVIRRESAKLFLWNQMFFIRRSGREALNFALQNYGLKPGDHEVLKAHFNRISEVELQTCLHHEMGEIHEEVFDRAVWRDIIATFPHTPIELLVRAVRDTLADTNEFGKLHYIARERRTASLGLHVAFLDGLRKEMSRELAGAFKDFMRKMDWAPIEEAAARVHDSAKDRARKICQIYREGKGMNDMKWAEREMERSILEPLGIIRPPAIP